MKRKEILNGLTLILLLVLALLLAGAAGLFRPGDPAGRAGVPAAPPLRMNQFTSIALSESDDQVQIIAGYRLEERYRNKAGIRVRALDKASGKTIMTGFAADDGSGSVSVVLTRNRHLDYPVNADELRVELLSDDGELLKESKLYRPIRWATWKTGVVDAAPPADYYQVSGKLHRLFAKHDFGALDELCERFGDGRLRTLDGRWRLEGFRDMLDLGVEDGRRERNAAILREWRAASTYPACAAIMEAESWLIHARGLPGYRVRNRAGGTASGAFRDSLERAERLLLESKAYAEGNPLWHERYIYTLRQLGRDMQEIMAAFLEAVEQEKYYYPVYTETALAMTPRLGGDYRLVERFANDAVRLTRGRDGDTAYTRIYLAIDNDIRKEGKLFEYTPVSWPRMRQGFQDIIRQYPDSDINMNLFASFACQAADADTYLELRGRVKPGLNTGSAWNSNYSLDVCDHMFMQRL